MGIAKIVWNDGFERHRSSSGFSTISKIKPIINYQLELEKFPIEEIESFLRKKKLEKLNENNV